MTTPWTCLLTAVASADRIRELARDIHRPDGPLAAFPDRHPPQIDCLAQGVGRLIVRGLRVEDPDAIRELARRVSEHAPVAVRITGHKAFGELFGAAARAGAVQATSGPRRVPDATLDTPWSGDGGWPVLMEDVEADVAGPLQRELTALDAPVGLI